MTVFNFGSINIDYVYRVPHLVQPGETLASQSMTTVLGGKGANQSVALARASAQVSHIGRVGESDQWAVDELSKAGVDVGSIECQSGVSGHAIIQVDDKGENSIILHGGANHTFDRRSLENYLAAANSGDWLLMQNECNAQSAAFDIAYSKGMSIAINPAPMDSAVLELPLERCNLIIVNQTEAAAIVGDASPENTMALLAQRFPQARLVLTLGGSGAVYCYHGNYHRQPAIDVDVVDTTGAGDTFVGYFLAGLLQELDEPSCLRRACSAAALSVTVAGATPSIPSAEMVNTFDKTGLTK